MNKYIFIASLSLLGLLSSCGSSSGKQVDDKTEKKVTAVIDSIVASEPDMAVTSLSVIKTQMPSMMAEEVEPALKTTGEMLGMYILAQAFGGKSSSDKEKIMKEIIPIGAPLREAMKKYESDNHPDYVFGLTRIANTKDSTLNEKRVYVFEENKLNEVKRVDKYKKKNASDVAMILVLAYGDQIDLDKEDQQPQDIKAINDNPVLKFIVTE